MFLLNGLLIDINSQNVISGITHPPGALADAAFRTSLGITEVPDPPMPDATYATVTRQPDGSWLSVPFPFEQVRAVATEKAESWKIAAEAGGFTHDAKTWPSDQTSMMRFTTAAVASISNPAFSQTFEAVDGSTVTLNQTSMAAFFGAMSAHVSAVAAQALTAKAAINAATSLAQIDAALAPLFPSNGNNGGGNGNGNNGNGNGGINAP